MNFKVQGIAHIPLGRVTVGFKGDNGDEIELITERDSGFSIGDEVPFQIGKPKVAIKEESNANSTNAASK